jgi:hypothetical protein
MEFGKFIVYLLGLYLIYYALNFVYDAYIKKDNKRSGDGDGEEVAFVGDIEPEEGQAVLVEEKISSVVEKKKLIDMQSIFEQSDFAQEPVFMEVETQAIPYSALMGDSKQLFAGIF